MRWGRSAAFAMLAGAALGTACRGNTGTTSSQPLVPTTFFTTGIAAFVSDFRTVAVVGQIAGSMQSGRPVSPGADAVSADAPAAVTNNGGTLAAIHAATPFNKILLSIVDAGAAIQGFWEVDLPAPVTDQVVLVHFVVTLPAPSFGLQFQVVSTAGVVSQPSTVDATVSSVLSNLVPSVIASFTPNPAPFENGAACTLTSELGCLWEFQVRLQEFNGVAVNPATLTETYTFPSGTVTNTIPIIIPGAGTGSVSRTIACGAATTSCVPADELTGGTYTYTVSGTDVNGNAFSFTGPVLTLLGR